MIQIHLRHFWMLLHLVYGLAKRKSCCNCYKEKMCVNESTEPCERFRLSQLLILFGKLGLTLLGVQNRESQEQFSLAQASCFSNIVQFSIAHPAELMPSQSK